ncbi:hypothetical protein Hypma_000545 [Hypsizygus marmoreus]|uniref:Uncharacterized protein n=1 Tax=Hypsizygus marmoreus TaxID=39966 RepID=A0A369JFJ1_HYPMA|nr:hypothetical protein Hypma_000545 [Hypsizygus marmoreus]
MLTSSLDMPPYSRSSITHPYREGGISPSYARTASPTYCIHLPIAYAFGYSTINMEPTAAAAAVAFQKETSMERCFTRRILVSFHQGQHLHGNPSDVHLSGIYSQSWSNAQFILSEKC